MLTLPASRAGTDQPKRCRRALTVKRPGSRHGRLTEAAARVSSGCDIREGSDLSRHGPRGRKPVQAGNGADASRLALWLTSLECDLRLPRFRRSQIKTNDLCF